jgi:hypothetical protein
MSEHGETLHEVHDRLERIVLRAVTMKEALQFIVDEVASQRRQHGNRTGRIPIAALDRIEHEARHALKETP